MHLAVGLQRTMNMLIPRVAISALALLCSFSAGAAPYLPQHDDIVLARVPTRLDPDARALAALRAQLTAAPQDLNAAIAYAQKALQIGHTRSDPRYYGYAEAALGPWWALTDAPQPVLVLRATIHQFFHAFDKAQNDLDRALLRKPNDDQARLIRATVHQVMGHPERALADCEQLTRQVEPLISTVCAASATSLMGRASRADTLLGFMLNQSKSGATESRLWAETLRAEIAERLGHVDEAQLAYQRALATMDALGLTDAYLLAAWADFALSQRQNDAVIVRLKNLTDIDNLLLRLALAEHSSGKHSENLAKHREMLEARFSAARQRGEAVHLREEAMYQFYLASDAASALRLAQENWQVQREPLDALLLLKAAKAARQVGAAQSVLEWMSKTGIEDQRLSRAAGALK